MVAPVVVWTSPRSIVIQALLAQVSKSEVGEEVHLPGAWSMSITLLGLPRSLHVKPERGVSHSSDAVTPSSWSRLMVVSHSIAPREASWTQLEPYEARSARRSSTLTLPSAEMSAEHAGVSIESACDATLTGCGRRTRR